MILFASCAQEKELQYLDFQYQRDLDDKDVQNILEWNDRRQNDSLEIYLSSNEPKIIYELALAASSLQDEDFTEKLLKKVYEVPSPKIRSVIYFASGQSMTEEGTSLLMELLLQEKDENALVFLKEAIGKQGSGEDLFALCSNYKKDDLGLIKAVYRFSQRNILTEEAIDIAIEALNWENRECRLFASNFLARIDYPDLNRDSDAIVNALKSEQDNSVKANLLTSMNKFKGTQNAALLLEIAENPELDFRLRVNALNSLNYYHYESTAPRVLKLIGDQEMKINREALNFFINRCKREEWIELAKTLKNTESPILRANLLGILLKYSRKKEKEGISRKISQELERYEDPFIIAEYINALSKWPQNYKLLSEYVFGQYGLVVNSAAMSAFFKLSSEEEFKKIPEYKDGRENELTNYFTQIFRSAVLSGETTLMGYGAKGLRNKNIDFVSGLDNTDFIEIAISNLDLPKDVETLIDLKKTQHYIEGKEDGDIEIPLNHFVEIVQLKEFQDYSSAIVHTNRGDFEMEFYSDLCPGTVANFIELSLDGFFDTLRIHRVENNFVAQLGCPRGDGWGSSGESIRSEFAPVYYDIGSVGMASAGKDTESCQWFVTHYPSHHLDGNYTNFASVSEGMKVVYSLNIGDTLLSVDIK